MAKLYVDTTDNLIDVAKTVAANPNTNVVLNGTPVSNQTLMSLAANQAMQGTAFANSVVPYAGTNFTGMNNNLGAQAVTLSDVANSPSQQSVANQPTVVPYSSSVIPSVSAGTNFTGMNNNLGAQAVTLSDVANSPSQQSVANQPTVTPVLPAPKPSTDTLANLGGTGTAKVADTNVAPTTTQGNSFLEVDATDLGYRGDLSDTAAMINFIKAANQAAANVGVTTPSADTLANLGGTGTVVEANKINTQGTGTAGTGAAGTGTAGTGTAGTGTAGTGTAGTGAAGTGTAGTGAAGTGTAATSPPSTINTGSIPALTTADLTNWYNTQPKGITADQLKTALGEQQTALSGQNTEFLKNWNSSADALKTNILSGVDTKNQAFGTQATQGFMDAFKNFQIPTNQQTGVNLGNYNDNRNAAADQWWSQYVTGRR
jgi:hypothetical protein